MSEFQALVESNRRLTEVVEKKVDEINQATAENSAKVDEELAKFQTKLPRIVMTQNQVLIPADGQTFPDNFSIGAGVTAEVFKFISNNPASRDAAQIELLQEIERESGVPLNTSLHYRQGFYVYKLSWTSGGGSWLAYPRAADNPSLSNVPTNTFFTVGAFVKVLSGVLSNDAWGNGNAVGSWKFCTTKYAPSSFGSYTHLHPYRNSEAGEILLFLPAAITGHIDDGENWFPNIVLG
ncbi:TPA: hypothetical protein I7141_18990 [Vibrio vulnificus]|nr:hypothetical protein [Vibrio vulnificus]